MATTDSNGILFYEDTDAVSPLHTLLNTGQQSVTNAVTALKAVPPFAMAAGTVSVPGVAAALSNPATVTFPAGRFTQPPIVTGSHAGAVITDGFVVIISAITTTQATVRIYRANGGVWSTAQTVNWQAVQMTSGSAAG